MGTRDKVVQQLVYRTFASRVAVHSIELYSSAIATMARWTYLVFGGLLTTTDVFSQYGLTGIPANAYDPVCATACLRSFYTMTLSCSAGGQTRGMATQPTSTECYAEKIAFLTSVAWCTHVQCEERQPPADLLEYWWEMQITGQKTAGARTVPTKWTYGQALAQITEEATLQLRMNDTSLDTTSLVPLHKWHAQYNFLHSTQEQDARMNKYGLVADQLSIATFMHTEV